MIFLAAYLALISCMLAGVLGWIEYRRTGELITPWIGFLGLSTIDFFLPGVFFLGSGLPELASYIRPFSVELLVPTILYAIFGLSFFAFGYLIVVGLNIKRRHDIQLSSIFGRWAIDVRWTYAGLAFSGVWYLVSLLISVERKGSLTQFLSERFLRVYGERAMYANVLEQIIMQLAPVALGIFLMLIGILFFYRRTMGRPRLWGLFFPVLGWLFTITTFYRGTQLIYFLMLMLLETLRLREQNVGRGVSSVERRRRTGLVHWKVVSYGMLAIVAFVGYGTFRNYGTLQEYGKAASAVEAVKLEAYRILRGEGIIGFARIIDAYPAEVDFFQGKTFYDMMMLPVPRAIYSSKPDWYGISSISIGMGGPTSTQDAVTIPGELYANFGIPGIPLAALFGAVFGLFYLWRVHPRLRFVYALIFPSTLFSTYWMSFTGFVNNVLVLPFAIVCVYLVCRRVNRLHPEAAVR